MLITLVASLAMSFSVAQILEPVKRVWPRLAAIAAIGPAALKACALAKRADMPMSVSYRIVLGVLNILIPPRWAKAMVSGATVSVMHILGTHPAKPSAKGVPRSIPVAPPAPVAAGGPGKVD